MFERLLFIFHIVVLLQSIDICDRHSFMVEVALNAVVFCEVTVSEMLLKREIIVCEQFACWRKIQVHVRRRSTAGISTPTLDTVKSLRMAVVLATETDSYRRRSANRRATDC